MKKMTKIPAPAVTPAAPPAAPMHAHEPMLLDLGISWDFLDEERKQVICDKLIEAGKAMQGEVGDLFGINLCFHVASSLVLLESTGAELNRALDRIRNNQDFSDLDPTVVVTIAALYHLIKAAEESDILTNSEKETIRYVHKRFDTMNWMVGWLGMKALGIKALHAEVAP